ncbi:MAG: DUF4358 domain-containing protein [Clostridia bacterium]|nr:DUF4358 domain-containing protein [Clostridia bacterium]
MKKIRLIALVCLLITVLLPLSACGDKPVQYKTDVSAQAIIDNCADELQLNPVDEDYLTFRMALDTSASDSYAVYVQNSGTTLDEIGVFRAVGDDTAALTEMIETYLKNRNDEWTGMYLVEEYPKLRDAEYRVIGKYVVYGILSEEAKAQFFTAVESYLKAD